MILSQWSREYYSNIKSAKLLSYSFCPKDAAVWFKAKDWPGDRSSFLNSTFSPRNDSNGLSCIFRMKDQKRGGLSGDKMMVNLSCSLHLLTASYFSNRLRYDNIGLLRICHLSFTLGSHGNSNRIAQEIIQLL